MLGTQQTYEEYLKDVRAKQFGWVVEEPTPLGDEVAKAGRLKLAIRQKKQTLNLRQLENARPKRLRRASRWLNFVSNAF